MEFCGAATCTYKARTAGPGRVGCKAGAGATQSFIAYENEMGSDRCRLLDSKITMLSPSTPSSELAMSRFVGLLGLPASWPENSQGKMRRGDSIVSGTVEGLRPHHPVAAGRANGGAKNRQSRSRCGDVFPPGIIPTSPSIKHHIRDMDPACYRNPLVLRRAGAWTPQAKP